MHERIKCTLRSVYDLIGGVIVFGFIVWLQIWFILTGRE